jgi:phosphoglycolate phosphatase
MSFDIVLFDLDGTLTDSEQGILNSFHYALNHFGIQAGDLRPFLGPPLADSFGKIGLAGDDIAVAIKKYREYFADKGIFENRVYDGIPEMLVHMKNTGKRLFVATSKAEPYAVRILEHFRLADHFEFIGGSEMNLTRADKAEVIRYVLEKAGNPDKNSAIMAGDRCYDVFGAKNAGISSVGVLYGYGSREELVEAGADYIAADTEELRFIV